MSIEKIKKDLAALLYYRSIGKGKKKQGFEKLDQKEQLSWETEADAVLLMLDKLNLALFPKGDLPKKRSVQESKQAFKLIIESFFSGIKVWKKDAIPVEELAHRLANEAQNG